MSKGRRVLVDYRGCPEKMGPKDHGVLQAWRDPWVTAVPWDLRVPTDQPDRWGQRVHKDRSVLLGLTDPWVWMGPQDPKVQ